MKKFEKQHDKYLVLKQEDIECYLSSYQQMQLRDIFCEIFRIRKQLKKKDNSYIVVNEDQPYASQVWKLIEEQWNIDNAETN